MKKSSSFLTKSTVIHRAADKLLDPRVCHVGVDSRQAVVAVESIPHQPYQVELVVVGIVAHQRSSSLAPTCVTILSSGTQFTGLGRPVADLALLKLGPQLTDTLRPGEGQGLFNMENKDNAFLYLDRIGRSTSLCLSWFVPQEATQHRSLCPSN